MKPGDADVLLSRTLLGLDQAGGAVNADDQIASDLRVGGGCHTQMSTPGGGEVTLN